MKKWRVVFDGLREKAPATLEKVVSVNLSAEALGHMESSAGWWHFIVEAEDAKAAIDEAIRVDGWHRKEKTT